MLNFLESMFASYRNQSIAVRVDQLTGSWMIGEMALN